VADEHAGQQARCPVCSREYTVPTADNTRSEASAESLVDSTTTASEVTPQPVDTSRWSLKTPEGAIYGPVDRASLDGWLADGRIASDCYLAEGNSGSWRRAVEVYPQLGSQPAAAPISRQEPANPFSDNPRHSTVGYQGVGSNTYLRPHRGGLILALGILGFMTCQILGVIAWIMGSSDLQEIRAGNMDPEGEGLTQAGTVLGMISAVLMAVVLVGTLLMMLLFAVVAAAQ
jgi:hypothetical protein